MTNYGKPWFVRQIANYKNQKSWHMTQLFEHSDMWWISKNVYLHIYYLKSIKNHSLKWNCTENVIAMRLFKRVYFLNIFYH